MLNETTHRRDGFRSGMLIRLADGQSWHFPVPSDVEDQDTLNLLVAIREAEDEAERYRAELALALHLFSRNYDLDPWSFHALFHFTSGGPELAESKQAFRELADASFRHLASLDEEKEEKHEPEVTRPFYLGGWVNVLSRLATRLHLHGSHTGDPRGEPFELLGKDARF